MPAGRPTLYSPEVVAKATHYLEHFNEDPYNDEIPSVCGLSLAIKVSRSTVYTWDTEEKQEFSDILENINARQHQELINKGLNGTFNSNICKLALGKHGYSDKNEIAGKDGAPLIPEQMTDLELARRTLFLLDKGVAALEDKD